MINLVVTPERMEKTRRIMEALQGSLGGDLCTGVPNDSREPFVVWGQVWAGAIMVPQAMRAGVPFYYVDNGYHMPAKGTQEGYYSLTYRGLKPLLLDAPDMGRLQMLMGDWRDPALRPNAPVLVAVPGPGYGEMFGWDMKVWLTKVIKRIREVAPNRTILLRDKSSNVPLREHMERAAVMVTHSSKAAVEAAVFGLPVICEPHCAAAPVAGTDLRLIETPPMPDRAKWYASLMCQQFTLDEMASGFARHWLDVAAAQGERDIDPGVPAESELV